MSEADAWDDEDYEPELPSITKSAGGTGDDKWEGEDDDGIARPKDNWEDEDEEESKAEQPTSADGLAFQRPKKKPLAERLADKQEQKQKDKEEKETREKEEKRELTAEEKLTEKIKLQRIQENDSLNLARGLFGEQDSSHSLDKMLPSTQEEFNQFAEALKTKITFFEDSPFYQGCLSKLISELTVGLGVEEVKKLGVQMNSLYHEKERLRKETEKKKKKKSKATIKVDRADDFDLINDATGGGAYYENDEDFI